MSYLSLCSCATQKYWDTSIFIFTGWIETVFQYFVFSTHAWWMESAFVTGKKQKSDFPGCGWSRGLVSSQLFSKYNASTPFKGRLFVNPSKWESWLCQQKPGSIYILWLSSSNEMSFAESLDSWLSEFQYILTVSQFQWKDTVFVFPSAKPGVHSCINLTPHL